MWDKFSKYMWPKAEVDFEGQQDLADLLTRGRRGPRPDRWEMRINR